MKSFKPLFLSALLTSLLFSCGSTAIISTPIENIDSSPLKTAELTVAEKQNWGHLDLLKDTIPGMSVDKAYAEIIKKDPIIYNTLDLRIRGDGFEVIWHAKNPNKIMGGSYNNDFYRTINEG